MKSVNDIKRQLQENPVTKISADKAKLKESYISKSGTIVLIPTAKGPDVITCEYFNQYGISGQVDVTPDYELTADKLKTEVIMGKHTVAKARCATLAKTKAATKTGGTITKTAKSTRVIDPRTGFGTTTTAHLVGTIMLDIGVKNKEACLEKLEKALEEFYPGKARHWARAWFANHTSKKPEIYKKG